MQQLHVADVVNVNLIIQNNDKSPSVELDCKDGRWKEKLTNGGLTLLIEATRGIRIGL